MNEFPEAILSVLEPIDRRLSVFSDVLQLRLLMLLEREELSLGEISQALQLAQSTASRKCRITMEAGWVSRRQVGTSSRYSFVLDDLTVSDRAVWIAIRDAAMGDAAFVEVAREDAQRLSAVIVSRSVDSRVFFGEVAEDWDRIRAELFGQHVLSWSLAALLPRDWVVADIGCGTGHVTRALCAHVRHVYAIDTNPVMIHKARLHLGDTQNVEFIETDADYTTLGDASVDACVCVLLLHHVDRPEEVVEELARITLSGGRVMIVDIVEHNRTEYRQSMGHVHLGFSEETMTGLLEGAGFEDVRVTALPIDPAGKGPALFAATGARAK